MERAMEGINGRRSYYNNNNDDDKQESFKLFGVSIALSKREEEKEEEGIKKSFSMGDLERRSCTNNNNNFSSNDGLPQQADDGYASDGIVHRERFSSSRNSSLRKKGLPWTEDEHRLFLCGLKKLGRGNWRGIAKEFVKTRTSTQVASHAQKYFLRKAGNDNIKRRASLFDLHAEASSSSSSEAARTQELQAQCTYRSTTQNPQMMENLLPCQAPLPQVLALSPTITAPYIARSDVHHRKLEEASKLGKVIFAPIVNYPRPDFAYLKNQGSVSCSQMDQWLQLGRSRIVVRCQPHQ